MADASTIQDFLVGIGFKIDATSQQKFESVLDNATVMVGKLGKASELAALGFVASIGHMTAALDQLFFTSKRVQSAASDISSIGFAASQMGVSVGEAQQSIEGLNRFLRENPAGATIARAWGVNVQNMHDSTQVLMGLRGVMLKQNEWFAYQLGHQMGLSSNMVRLLRDQTGAFDAWIKEGKEASEAFDLEGATKQANTFWTAWREFSYWWDSAINKMYADIAEQLTPVLKALTDALRTNGPGLRAMFTVIGQVVGGIVKMIAGFLTEMSHLAISISTWWGGLTPQTRDFAAGLAELVVGFRMLLMVATPLRLILFAIIGIMDDFATWSRGGRHALPWDAFKKLYDTISPITNALGGWKTIMTALVAIKMVSWLSGWTGALGTLSEALGTPGAKGLGGAGILGKLAMLNYMTLALSAAQRAPEEMAHPEKWDPHSPLWKGMPEEEQKKYKNAPFFHKDDLGPWWQNWGERLLNAVKDVGKGTPLAVDEPGGATIGGGGTVRVDQSPGGGMGTSPTGTAGIQGLPGGPSGAAGLAGTSFGSLIASGEGDYTSVNRGAAGGYRAGKEDLANKTVAEVMADQAAQKYNAAGRYQIIGPTLRKAVESMHLTGAEKFDQKLQDRIFDQYLAGTKRPEIAAYVSGRSNDMQAAQLAAAQEWASVADPRTGKSYYDKVGNNRASISAERMAAALQQSREQLAAQAALKPTEETALQAQAPPAGPALPAPPATTQEPSPAEQAKVAFTQPASALAPPPPAPPAPAATDLAPPPQPTTEVTGAPASEATAETAPPLAHTPEAAPPPAPAKKPGFFGRAAHALHLASAGPGDMVHPETAQLTQNLAAGNYAPPVGPSAAGVTNEGDTSATMHQTTNINISGAGDPHAVGQAVAASQDRVHSNMLRNTKTMIA